MLTTDNILHFQFPSITNSTRAKRRGNKDANAEVSLEITTSIQELRKKKSSFFDDDDTS